MVKAWLHCRYLSIVHLKERESGGSEKKMDKKHLL